MTSCAGSSSAAAWRPTTPGSWPTSWSRPICAGIHSHGVMRVPLLCRQAAARAASIRAADRGSPRTQGAALVIDGGNSMGQVAGVFAMRAGDRRARDDQCRGRRLGNSNHCGRDGVLRAHGGRRRHDRHRHHQRAADHGALGRHRQARRPQPDRHRHSRRARNRRSCSTSPSARPRTAACRSTSRRACRSPRAGRSTGRAGRPPTSTRRSTAWSSRSACTRASASRWPRASSRRCSPAPATARESGNMVDGPIPGRDGQFYLALSIAAFEDSATFKARMDRIIRRVQGHAARAGRPARLRAGRDGGGAGGRQREQGVPLNEATVAGIRACRGQLGVDATRALLCQPRRCPTSRSSTPMSTSTTRA